MSRGYEQLNEPEAYEITMGTYKPHFRGQPDDYWETTYLDFFSAIFAMLCLIALFVGLSILIVNWSLYLGTQSYATALSAATACFIVLFLILNYYLSRGKKKRQKQVMRKALNKFREKSGSSERDSESNHNDLQMIQSHQTILNLLQPNKQSKD